jgi:hypothetical protein
MPWFPLRATALRSGYFLTKSYYGQSSKDNEAAYQYSATPGVPARWTPVYFALTRQKNAVVDCNQALIMTFNFRPQYYSLDRGFPFPFFSLKRPLLLWNDVNI